MSKSRRSSTSATPAAKSPSLKKSLISQAIAMAGLNAGGAFAACPGTVTAASAAQCTLGTGQNVIVETNGSIAVTGTTALVVQASADSVVTNSGTISSDTGYGIYYAPSVVGGSDGNLGGSLTNNEGGLIQGVRGVFVNNTVLEDAVITNAGTIRGINGAGDTAGFQITDRAIVGSDFNGEFQGTFTNTSTGLIEGHSTNGDAWGVNYDRGADSMPGSSFTNDGQINATAMGVGTSVDAYGVEFYYQFGEGSGAENDGVVINNATITATATTEVSGDAEAYGVYYEDYLTGIFTNSEGASIVATATGAEDAEAVGYYGDSSLYWDAVWTNDGTITATAISNNGSAEATGAYFYYLYGGTSYDNSTVINNGTITATADASGINDGAYAYGMLFSDIYSDTPSENHGTIIASATSDTDASFNQAVGVYIDDIGTAYLNTETGVIEASTTAMGNSASAQAMGIFVFGTMIENSVLTNAGSISATAVSMGTTSAQADAFGIFINESMEAGSQLLNTGTITVSAESPDQAMAAGIFVDSTVYADTLISNTGVIDVTATAGTGGATAMGMAIESGYDMYGVWLNDGSITAAATASDSTAESFGIYIGYDVENPDGRVKNGSEAGSDASIVVTATGQDATAHGIFIDSYLYSDTQLVNNGTIDATATATTGSARVNGLFLDSSFDDNALVENAGTINLVANGVTKAEAFGIYSYSDLDDGSTINNSGSISLNATASAGAATGYGIFVEYDFEAGGLLSNTGSIAVSVTGTTTAQATGIHLERDYDGIDALTDSDSSSITVSATAQSGMAEAYGIYLNTMLAGSSFSTSGSISAEATGSTATAYAVYINGGAGGTFTNNGSLEGGVFSADAAGVVVNNGRLAGSSSLAGNYTQGADGVLVVDVRAEDDFDTTAVAGTADFSAGANFDITVAGANTTDYYQVTFDDVVTAGTLTMGESAVTDNSLVWNFAAVADGNTIDLTAVLDPEIDIPAGTTLEANDAGVALLIPDTAGASPSVITLGGALAGDVQLGDSALRVASSEAMIAGDIIGADGASVLINNAFTYEGNIVADVAVTSLGVNLAGSIDGDFLNQGDLNLNGGVSGDFTNNGTLRIPEGTVVNVGGNYTQVLNGKLVIGVQDASSYGQLAVAGTADIANNDLEIEVSVTEALEVNSVLEDVVSSSGLSFDADQAITDDSLIWGFTAQMDGDSLDLLVERSVKAEEIVAATGTTMAAGAAAALDDIIEANNYTGAMETYINALSTYSEDQLEDVSQAIAETIPTLAGTSADTMLQNLNTIRGVVSTRLAKIRGVSAGDPAIVDQHMWLRVIGGEAEQDAKNGFEGYEVDTYSLVLGFDRDLSNNWLIGGAVAYSTMDAEGKSTFNRNETDTNSLQFLGYGQKEWDKVFFSNLTFSMGFNDTDTSRRIQATNSVDAANTLDVTAKGEFDSRFVQLSGEIGRDYYSTEKLTMSPVLMASYVHLKEDSYTESGAGNLGLSVEDRDEEVFVFGIDVRAAYDLSSGSDRHLLTAHVGAATDSSSGASVISSRFISGGPTFNTRGAELDSQVVNAGIGYEWARDDLEITFNYEHEDRSDYTSDWLTAKARWSF